MRWIRGVGLWAAWAAAAWAGVFGTAVAIGGHASDIALDEARGVLYIANFNANRIEVMGLGDLSIRRSINVAAQPGALAVSPDGQFLVATHFGNFQAPNSPSNALTVIDLGAGTKQTYALGSPPLGVAFGIDNRALVATSTDFLLFDPVSGALETLGTVSEVTAATLPAPPPSFPPEIVAASLAASGDGRYIYGLTDTIRFRYEVYTKQVISLGYTSSPPLGPRVVSVTRDGGYYAAGWALFDGRGWPVAEFRNPSGALHIGSHAMDSDRNILYAQIPEGGVEPGTAPPVLMIADAGNLAVRERLRLPENLAGKSILSADGSVLYSVSDSGVVVMPVGRLAEQPRVAASQEDLVFRGNFCDRRTMTQEIAIVSPGGKAADFSLSVSAPGITVSPASGLTPATVRVTVDGSAFKQQKGTAVEYLEIRSAAAVNVTPRVRLLINTREPDQRGSVVNVPGKLVDLLADPVRDRFYILRQDTNEVLVFDGSSHHQVAALRTSNGPTQMAVTFDRKYLLIGHNNAQQVLVYDLDTLEQELPIRFPPGHYPRSVAASGRAILAASRVAGPAHTIDRIDLLTRKAVELPSLGVFENRVPLNTVLTASPNGAQILAAMEDGGVMLYDANADTFTAYRKDFPSLAGAYAASSFGWFVADRHLLNASLVRVKELESGTGASSGFAFVDDYGFRSTSALASAPGVVQRVDLSRGEGIRPTRTAESPLVGDSEAVFTRTLAPLANRSAIVSLSVSGFTVLAWDYDAAVAPPQIERVVNAADEGEAVASGGLISVFGSNLSPVNLATREIPLPTALGESCLTVNGVALPMLFVSPRQINAQLPFHLDGNAQMVLRTPGGVSDNYNLRVMPAAPAVFRSGTAGPETGIATVVRGNGELATLANPLHRGDEIVIYATGLGRTSPEVEAGTAGPSDPLSLALIEPAVTLGGVRLPVVYAGLAPGQVGVYQINALVPEWVPTGMEVPLVIRQGGGATSLAMRVVR
ncbi:MAG: hypothetical protein IT158_25070 [Bryobacterales bacterium]|nr:hypothetical protein [Bryobacterales bacterium]